MPRNSPRRHDGIAITRRQWLSGTTGQRAQRLTRQRFGNVVSFYVRFIFPIFALTTVLIADFL